MVMMKNKLMLMLVLVVLALVWAWPAAAQAANVPVYLEGERVATAVARGGYTYLPLRTMFETLGADVKWDAAERKIEATMPLDILNLRARLLMQVGSKEAESESAVFGGHNRYQMDRAPYISRGTVYVPLRFVTEDVFGFDVKWRGGAVYLSYPKLTYTEGTDVYTLNIYNGELRLAENGGSERSLGFCPAPGYATYQPVYLTTDLQLYYTEAGNYILQADGMMHSEPSHGIRWFAWLRPTDGLSYASYDYYNISESMPGAAFGGGKVLMNTNRAMEDAELLIDEASGQLTKLDFSELVAAALPQAGQYCWTINWTDGRYVLLNNGLRWLIYDLESGGAQDITMLVDTTEAQAVMRPLLETQMAEYDDFLQDVGVTQERSIEERLEAYWAFNDDTIGQAEFYGRPYLFLLKEENGVLYFKLRCSFSNNYYIFESKEFMVSLNIAELLQ